MSSVPCKNVISKFWFFKVEGEHKLSTLAFLGLEAISYARVLQNLKISWLGLKFIQIEEI